MTISDSAEQRLFQTAGRRLPPTILELHCIEAEVSDRVPQSHSLPCSHRQGPMSTVLQPALTQARTGNSQLKPVLIEIFC